MELPARLVVLSTLIGLWMSCQGCTVPKEGEKQTTTDWKYKYSEVLALGVVKSRTLQSSHQSGDVYTVEFEVYCIYKGAPLDPVINIEVGDAPGQCDNLTEGEKFLVFLNTADDGRFVQSYKPDSGEDTFVHEVLVLCGVTTSYPTGIDKANAKEPECEQTDYSEDCVPEPVPTNPPVPESEGKPSSSFPDDSDDQPPAADQGQGKVDANNVGPNEPKESPRTEVGGGNGSRTLTLNLTLLIFLLLQILALK